MWHVLKAMLLAGALTAGAGAGVTNDRDGDGVVDENDVCCETPPGITVDADGRPIGDLDGDCDVDQSDYGIMQANFTGARPPGEGPCPVECSTSADCPTMEYCQYPNGECDGIGVCEEMPTICPDVWMPVCGCDGMTYGNACEAAAAGVSIDYEGECKNTCTDNTHCSPDQYCAKGPGDCQGEGMCESKPLICPDVWAPVCGCDGITYGNECEAAAAGVNIEYAGQCAGTCLESSQCDPQAYCAKADGDCDGQGVCTPRPEICPTLWDPVCGCDGVTYPNDCAAAIAGVNVDHPGECAAACLDNSHCDAASYCEKLPGDCEGVGGCTPKPLSCPDVWAPVCGCDDITYGNACEAAMAGVSVRHEGECVPTCLDNSDCQDDNYCAKPEGQCHAEGVCEPRPQICIALWDPVCGCDGRTYGNACEAARAGVSLADPSFCQLFPGGCVTNQDCGWSEYCSKADGDCEGFGQCVTVPDFCTAEVAPVCGCDGNTHSNACYAAMARVNVAYAGECQP